MAERAFEVPVRIGDHAQLVVDRRHGGAVPEPPIDRQRALVEVDRGVQVALEEAEVAELVEAAGHAALGAELLVDRECERAVAPRPREVATLLREHAEPGVAEVSAARSPRASTTAKRGRQRSRASSPPVPRLRERPSWCRATATTSWSPPRASPRSEGGPARQSPRLSATMLELSLKPRHQPRLRRHPAERSSHNRRSQVQRRRVQQLADTHRGLRGVVVLAGAVQMLARFEEAARPPRRGSARTAPRVCAARARRGRAVRPPSSGARGTARRRPGRADRGRPGDRSRRPALPAGPRRPRPGTPGRSCRRGRDTRSRR